MKIPVLALLLILSLETFSQQVDTVNIQPKNTAESLLSGKHGLTIGGYGEVHYNQPLNQNHSNLGILDAHRLVMFLGYNFSNQTQFVSEIEFEYAKEIWVEQMFIQHRLNKFMNFRAGILLIPMGIINEYHEPTTFNGVERPMIDNRISPTTWREIGLGFQGNLISLKTRYQVYLVNGLNSYDGGKALFSGSKALREGRQKGSKAIMLKPALTAKVEFYGVNHVNLGISNYFGESTSGLYNNLPKDSVNLLQKADSSVVNISMLGADVRYNHSGVKITAQLYYTTIANTYEYNLFAATGGKPNDLGSAMIGYYVELAYDIFKPFSKLKSQLMPFVRYETYNTHYKVKYPVIRNKNYHNSIITTGLTYTITKGAVLKADLQLLKSEADNRYSKILNVGLGVTF